MRYLVILERSKSGWGAHVPDLPGCVAVAETKPKVIELIKEAVDLHVASLRHSGDEVPRPSSESLFVETSAA
ncbi:MAG TPA: type II toxin-antitoxin system HicB family antitoxin [Pseudomonadales bacterium]|jgi:predicted RNase H-like HicB family nuclease|nr:type II toxin-antitoxin system HicB family antitoxin [Pseudomonadales bacterium]